MEENEGKEDNSAVVQALDNFLIIRHILSKLTEDEFEAKKFRLVSRTFNDVILTWPNQKLKLLVNSMYAPDNSTPAKFEEFTATMDKRLARCIGATTKTDMFVVTRTDPFNPDYLRELRMEANAYINLKHCIETCSDRIQTIDLYHNYVKIDYIPVLHQLLSNYCPNLVNLWLDVDGLSEEQDVKRRQLVPKSINQTWRNFTRQEVANLAIIPMRIKSKLRTIRIELSERTDVPTRQTDGKLHTFYQQLLFSSPNLISLTQKFIAFPDFRALLDLKHFTFKVELRPTDFNAEDTLAINFDLTGLSRMLAQVSHSLQILNLKMDHRYCPQYKNGICDCNETLKFAMPRMKSLYKFKCWDFDMFFPFQQLHGFNNLMTHNKNLQIVDLAREWFPDVGFLSNMLDYLCDHAGLRLSLSYSVTTLVLNGIVDFRPLLKLKRLFPNLMELSLNQNEKSNTAMEEEQDLHGESITDCQLAHALDACLALDLACFGICCPLPITFFCFVHVLYNKKEMLSSGRLKVLRIVGSGTDMDYDRDEDIHLIDKMEEIFMATQNMESVLMSNLCANIPMRFGIRLGKLIAEHNLPIQVDHLDDDE